MTRRSLTLLLLLVLAVPACAQRVPSGQPLPDTARQWWEGLTPAQREGYYLIDRGLNLVLPNLPGEAVPGQTISERAALAREKGDQRGAVICMFLDLADPGHCERAIRR